MSNEYFNASGTPADNSEVTSPNLRSEFTSVANGFDKMPALTGNALKTLRINASETAIEAQSDTGSEGTFVPTAIGIGSPTYVTQYGRYSKVGPLCFIEIALSWNGGTDATAFTIGTLPFQAINYTSNFTVSVNENGTGFTWTGQLVAQTLAIPSTTIRIMQMTSGALYTDLLNRNAGFKGLRLNGYYVWA